MKYKNKRLRRAITQALGLAALTGLSSQASAVTFSNLGAVELPTQSITSSGNSGAKAFSDYGTGVNNGWTHTATFVAFQVGSIADIAAGNRFDVNINLQSTTARAPGFSLFTSGTNPTNNPTASGSGYGHHWNQVRGPYDGGTAGNPCSIDCALGSNGWMGAYGYDSEGSVGDTTYAPGNILHGHDGWVGYANAGYSFFNSDGDHIGGLLTPGAGNLAYTNLNTSYGNPATAANVNTSSPWVNGGYATLATGDAMLDVFGLKAGYYMLGLGGSCPDGAFNGETCGSPGFSYNLSITNVATSPVPLPGAAWLFGGAIAGLLGTNRRKKVLPA